MASGKNEIAILNKKIPTTIEDIEISKLRFWVENPRVNSSIKKLGDIDIDDKDVENILRNEEHVKELYQEIKRHGGLIEEILVKGDVVLEGNSRLCAYRMLYEKAEQSKDEDEMLKWLYIKSKKIPEDTTDEEIFTILGTLHIKGKKQWDTFEKAAYLKKMRDTHNYPSSKIAELIGESKSVVDSSIMAHDLMVDNQVYDLSKYSYFIELVKNRSINIEQEKDGQTRNKIIKAIKNNQFNKAEEIRDVSKVLKDKVAKRTFFEEQIKFNDALDIATDRHPELAGAIYNTLKKASTILSKMEVSEIEKIKEEISGDANKKYIIRQLQKEVKKFCKSLGIQE